MKLMKYDNIDLGPRRIPNCERPDDGTSTIGSAATFSIDLELQQVTLHENGRPVEIGSQVIYNIF